MSIVERPCPNCNAKNSLQLDSARGEVACEECGIVVAEGLEEDAGTRYVKDAVMADVDEEVRGGYSGGSFVGKAEATSTHEVNKSLNPRLVSYLQRLHERAKLPRAALDDATELCRLLTIKKRELNQRVEKPFATAAACYLVGSQRQHSPISPYEVIAMDQTLNLLDVKKKENEILDVLNIAPTPSALFQRDAVRLFLMRLRWNLGQCEPIAIAVAAALDTLRVEGLTAFDDIIASLMCCRVPEVLKSVREVLAVSDQTVGELSQESTAIVQELQSATRYPETRLRDLLKTVVVERRNIVVHLEQKVRTKRPREE